MPARKNNWLNAKPVTRTGGNSGGARNPAKPYNKPASTSGTPKIKTKVQKLQQAAKTKPSSPAPKQVMKKPVTRTGPVKGPVPPKGSTGSTNLPNSQRAGVNLPKTGARAERTATRAIQPRSPITKPAVAPKPAAPSVATSAGSRIASGAGRLARGAGRALGAVGVVGAMASEIKAMSDRNKTFSWNRQKPKASTNKPFKPQYQGPGGNPNGSGQGQARQTTPRVNKARQDQMRADLNRDYPLSTADQRRGTTQSGGGSTQSRSGGGTTSARSSAPAAPRRQPAATAPAKPFGGTVSEGRRIWAEKYSSSKYDGQAIQKEAQAVLKKLKEEKNNQSNAQRAGWDGNKNY